MRLVRAKAKAPEFIPEWRKCCPDILDRMARAGVFVVDLDDSGISSGTHRCRFCLAPEPACLAVRVVEGDPAGKYVSLETLDLDEGSVCALPA